MISDKNSISNVQRTGIIIKRVPNKVYFFSAMTAFTVGSLAAILSVNFSMLLISRLFQAIGCGMLLPFAQIVLLKLYPKENKVGIKPMLVVGTGLFAVYSVTGFLFSQNTSIIYISDS